MKKFLWSFVLVVILISTPLVKAEAPKVISQPTIDPLKAWIDVLETKELDKRFPRDYCRIDSNGRLSCGCLQFQFRTFREQAEKYHIDGDWKACDIQKKLAYDMLSNDLENAWHWATSVKKIGLPKL